MSTFGTVVWVDLRPDGPVTRVVDELVRRSAAVWVHVEPAWVRVTATPPHGGDPLLTLARGLGAVGWARIAVAEDHDEYGACWTVAAVEAGTTRVVHRRYVLAADPDDPADVALALTDFEVDGEVRDPRAQDVTGSAAARASARLFEVPEAAAEEAEAASATAHRHLGVVGGPFPWREALGLPWPGPEAGRPVTGGPAG